jgi:putative IMPACT (imprinted ancient) family translation regulator
VLVVVIRYFGGVKLGVGGLIAAYRAAAEDALNQAVIIEKQITRMITIQYRYEATPTIMKLVKDFKLTIVNQVFEEECVLQLNVDESVWEGLNEKLKFLKSTGTDLKVTSE